MWMFVFCKGSSILSGGKKFSSSEPYSSGAVSLSENLNPFFAIGEEEKDLFSKLSNSAEDKTVDTSLRHSSLEGKNEVFSGHFCGEVAAYGFKCAPVARIFFDLFDSSYVPQGRAFVILYGVVSVCLLCIFSF